MIEEVINGLIALGGKSSLPCPFHGFRRRSDDKKQIDRIAKTCQQPAFIFAIIAHHETVETEAIDQHMRHFVLRGFFRHQVIEFEIDHLQFHAC